MFAVHFSALIFLPTGEFKHLILMIVSYPNPAINMFEPNVLDMSDYFLGMSQQWNC